MWMAVMGADFETYGRIFLCCSFGQLELALYLGSLSLWLPKGTLGSNE
jgi:hypothetical protein